MNSLMQATLAPSVERRVQRDEAYRGEDRRNKGVLDKISVSISSQPVASACDIEVITTRKRFDGIETYWNALFENAARPDQLFQNFNWLWHWANHFLDGRTKLRIIAGWHEQRLVMVWPLAETKSFGLRKLIWMGEPVSQYGDALVEPGTFSQDMLTQGWRKAQDLGADFALLRKTRAASSAAMTITDATLCTTAGAPLLDFGDAANFEDVFARLPGKVRSSHRRLWRRLTEKGDITFSGLDQAQAPDELVRHAFELKRTWLARRGRYSSAIESDATLAFFVDVALSKEHPVAMPIDAVYCGGRPIGIGISLSCKDETLGHIIAHDGGFDKQGIGVVLTEHVLKSSFDRGCRRFDMLAPQDSYKMEWTSDAPLVHDWIKSFTIAGRFYERFYVSGLPQLILERLKNLSPSTGRILWPMMRKFKKLLKR